jgi:hypothetical protein
MPLFIKALDWWLFPKPGASKIPVNIGGTALVFILFAAEVTVLWHLL